MNDSCSLNIDEDFTKIIKKLITDNAHAHLIFDVDGLERASGKIIKIDETNTNPLVTLDNEILINVSSIIAINGIFKSNFSCC